MFWWICPNRIGTSFQNERMGKSNGWTWKSDRDVRNRLFSGNKYSFTRLRASRFTNQSCIRCSHKTPWGMLSPIFIMSVLGVMVKLHQGWVKGISDPNHFIFEINVGKSRIRHTTTLKLNDKFQIDSKSVADDVIPILSRSMSDPPLSDIDF